MEPFETSIKYITDWFNEQQYIEKLKKQITPLVLPSENKKLLAFLYNQVVEIQWFVPYFLCSWIFIQVSHHTQSQMVIEEMEYVLKSYLTWMLMFLNHSLS